MRLVGPRRSVWCHRRYLAEAYVVESHSAYSDDRNRPLFTKGEVPRTVVARKLVEKIYSLVVVGKNNLCWGELADEMYGFGKTAQGHRQAPVKNV